MELVENTSKLEHGRTLSGEELLDFLPALKEVPKGVFNKFAQDAAALREIKAGEILCREGEFGSTAFYLVSGSVEIFIENPLAHVSTTPASANGLFGHFYKRMSSFLTSEGRPAEDTEGKRKFFPVDASVDLKIDHPQATLEAGELFGEMTCRTFMPRSATIRAKEDCVIVEMLRVILDMLVGTREIQSEIKSTTKVKAPTFKGTTFKEELDKKYRERSLKNHLKSVPIFEELSQDFIDQLAENVELKTYHKGEVICQQGDVADRFYLIRQGLVKVSQAMPGGEMVKTYLCRGEYFGEMGLILQAPRTATCTASETVDLVEIGLDDFEQMLARFPSVYEELDRVSNARLDAQTRQTVTTPVAGSKSLEEALDQGLLQAQNLLLIDLHKCTRCDLCVQACADAHDGISRLLRDGLRYENYLVATACRSCQDPLCMTQCPVGSIRRKDNLEIIIEDWCIGCSKCAELCPYGNINMHPVPDLPMKGKKRGETKKNGAESADGKKAAPAKKAKSSKATTCDLCTEMKTPSCVYACPHDAAMRVNPVDFFSRKMPHLKNFLYDARSRARKDFRTTH
ncbi:MAG: cyclic nucleotide-binding domain-containing protein [Verrucomicrobiota bacterium]